MCPATSAADVDVHEAVLARFVKTAIAEGAVRP
jgi:hypothetical protein